MGREGGGDIDGEREDIVREDADAGRAMERVYFQGGNRKKMRNIERGKDNERVSYKKRDNHNAK